MRSVDELGASIVRSAAASARLDPVAAALSHAGRGAFVWFGCAALVGAGRRPLSRLEGSVVSAASIAFAFGSSIALARAVGRRRPCDRGARSLVPCPRCGSFPSDQAAASFAAAEVLGWLAPPARQWLFRVATTMAAARVAAGVHYPTDVIAGGLIGTAVGRAARAVAESAKA